MLALPTMLNALTTRASGSQRCTCSPPESVWPRASPGGCPGPAKASGLVASITTLPARLSAPASRRAFSVPLHAVASTASSAKVAASAKVPVNARSPTPGGPLDRPRVLGVARAHADLVAQPGEAGAQRPPDVAGAQDAHSHVHALPSLRLARSVTTPVFDAVSGLGAPGAREGRLRRGARGRRRTSSTSALRCRRAVARSTPPRWAGW